MTLPYSKIASLLEEVSRVRRVGKSDIVAEFLSGLEAGQVCCVMRLLSGKLWSAWDRKDMNVGPGLLEDVLQELSQEDVLQLRQRLGELGDVAEAALSSKTQQPIYSEPLDSIWVYQSLYRISNQKGQDSEYRKRSIIRGLFLEASPIEGKYIARTLLRNVSVGLGSNTFLLAVAKAFNYDYLQLKKAFALMPEIGILAESACRREIELIKFLPSRPMKSMIITRDDKAFSNILLLKYPGVRIQLHWIGKRMHIYSSRLRDITGSLSSLSKYILNFAHDLVIEGEIIILRDGQILGSGEVIKYINQIHHPDPSKICPAVVAHDLLFIDDQDLLGLPYEKRYRRLASLLGDPKGPLFCGLNLAQQIVIKDEQELEKIKAELHKSGYLRLIARDPMSPYHPGMRSDNDFMIRIP
jgi:DNA ligase-1